MLGPQTNMEVDEVSVSEGASLHRAVFGASVLAWVDVSYNLNSLKAGVLKGMIWGTTIGVTKADFRS